LGTGALTTYSAHNLQKANVHAVKKSSAQDRQSKESYRRDKHSTVQLGKKALSSSQMCYLHSLCGPSDRLDGYACCGRWGWRQERRGHTQIKKKAACFFLIHFLTWARAADARVLWERFKHDVSNMVIRPKQVACLAHKNRHRSIKTDTVSRKDQEVKASIASTFSTFMARFHKPNMCNKESERRMYNIKHALTYNPKT
jgi:hypothetical protein